MMLTTQQRAELEARGLAFDASLQVALVKPEWRRNYSMALDAQPALGSTPNSAIPWFLANFIDPQVVEYIFQPLRVATILGGDVKKGDWTTATAQFPVSEITGYVSSYGDYNNNGTTGANFNWENRQSYHFQTVSQYGEKELAIYGLAALDYKAEVDKASQDIIARFHNQMGFYGMEGLENFGLLNDPSLPVAISPTTKAAGGTTWANATADEIYADVLKTFTQLQTQMGGNLEYGASIDLPLTLALSAERATLLQRTNTFGINVIDLLKKNFPGLEIISAPQYATDSGQLMQMILREYQGVQTAYPGFTEKLRAHAVIPGLSNFMQKKSAGGWGTVIRRPLAIAQMLGI